MKSALVRTELPLTWAQLASVRDLKQRRHVTVRLCAPKADVRLDCWPSEVPVEDRLGRFQAHSLVTAVEQLAQALNGSGR